MQIPVSRRAAQVEYAIRDVVVPATALERQGHQILKLNIGDPLAYPGLPTPEHMIGAFQTALANQQNGYSPSYGIPSLREALAADESSKGWPCRADDIYVCHGVTEALQILLAATIETGDQVLSPGPHYPPYMTYPAMYGGETVEYRMNPDDAWKVDLEDLRTKMNERVKLLVLINPNNPTGGVIDRETIEGILEIASQWPQCMVISDEIYDGLNFDQSHVSTASVAHALDIDVPVVTLNGVSKVYYAPGWRIGYFAVHDANGRMALVRDGAERLLRSRLCASTPAQMGYLAGLTGPKDWMTEYRDRVRTQRDYCIERINALDGLETQTPGGAFYLFPRITHPKWSNDDKGFVLGLLQAEKVLMVHGSGFSPDYGRGFARIVYLPGVDILEQAFDRVERFLKHC